MMLYKAIITNIARNIQNISYTSSEYISRSTVQFRCASKIFVPLPASSFTEERNQFERPKERDEKGRRRFLLV